MQSLQDLAPGFCVLRWKRIYLKNKTQCKLIKHFITSGLIFSLASWLAWAMAKLWSWLTWMYLETFDRVCIFLSFSKIMTKGKYLLPGRQHPQARTNHL